jgi:hypothetical protein
MSDKTFDQNVVGSQFNLSLTINNVSVSPVNVNSSVLREWIFDQIVTYECTFMDTGTFVELSPLYDECPVQIEFSKNGDLDKVKMDMVINAWEIERVDADDGSLYIIHFIAFQKTTDYFYPIRFRPFSNQGSSDALQFVCQESGIDFVLEDSSNDNQTWIQSNVCNYAFTKHLMTRAFIRPEDLPLFYFNRHNQAVYSSLSYKTNSKPKFLAINNDHAFMDNGNDTTIAKIKEQIGKDSETLFYRTGITYKNLSPILNKMNGYGIDFTYFDHTNFFDYSLNFPYAPLSKFENKNKNNIGKYTNGITYNSLSKNVHENYLLAKSQNLYLKQSFFGNYLQITINPNMNINIGDKIDVLIYDNLGRLFNGTPNVDAVNSGEYLVGGISHDIKKDGLYSMILTLFRNGTNQSNLANILFEGNLVNP